MTSLALSRPEVRAVLEDEALEQGKAATWGWLLWQAQRLSAAAADDDAVADDDAADSAADSADDAAASAADDSAAADSADDAAAAADARAINQTQRRDEMREGLVLIHVVAVRRHGVGGVFAVGPL